jgi:hypothetical protein
LNFGEAKLAFKSNAVFVSVSNVAISDVLPEIAEFAIAIAPALVATAPVVKFEIAVALAVPAVDNNAYADKDLACSESTSAILLVTSPAKLVVRVLYAAALTLVSLVKLVVSVLSAVIRALISIPKAASLANSFASTSD